MMNVPQAQKRLGEILGKVYWHEQGQFPLAGGQATYMALHQEMQVIKEGLRSGKYAPETKANGTAVYRSWHSVNRYLFDNELPQGWQQYDTDQDAWYFGVWVNLQTLQTLTYAEGDVTLTTSPTVETMAQELDEMADYFEDGIVMVVADGFTVEGKLENATAVYGNRASRADLFHLYKEGSERAKMLPLTPEALRQLIYLYK